MLVAIIEQVVPMYCPRVGIYDLFNFHSLCWIYSALLRRLKKTEFAFLRVVKRRRIPMLIILVMSSSNCELKTIYSLEPKLSQRTKTDRKEKEFSIFNRPPSFRAAVSRQIAIQYRYIIIRGESVQPSVDFFVRS